LRREQALQSAAIRSEYPQEPIASARAIVIRDDRVLLVRRAFDLPQGR